MTREQNPEGGVLDRAVSFVERCYERVGFGGLTDNQKVLFCVHDLHWSDFLQYFCRGEAWLEENVGDAEPTAAQWEQHDAFQAECEQWQDWAAAGLQRIGAPKAARAFEQARRTCDWDKWERRFRNAEDIEELLLAFVREHPEDFRPGSGR